MDLVPENHSDGCSGNEHVDISLSISAEIVSGGILDRVSVFVCWLLHFMTLLIMTAFALWGKLSNDEVIVSEVIEMLLGNAAITSIIVGMVYLVWILGKPNRRVRIDLCEKGVRLQAKNKAKKIPEWIPRSTFHEALFTTPLLSRKRILELRFSEAPESHCSSLRLILNFDDKKSGFSESDILRYFCK